MADTKPAGLVGNGWVKTGGTWYNQFSGETYVPGQTMPVQVRKGNKVVTVMRPTPGAATDVAAYQNGTDARDRPVIAATTGPMKAIATGKIKPPAGTYPQGPLDNSPAERTPQYTSAIQKFLKARGYDLSVDGKWGDQTESAFEDWHKGLGGRNPSQWNVSRARAGMPPVPKSETKVKPGEVGSYTGGTTPAPVDPRSTQAALTDSGASLIDQIMGDANKVSIPALPSVPDLPNFTSQYKPPALLQYKPVKTALPKLKGLAYDPVTAHLLNLDQVGKVASGAYDSSLNQTRADINHGVADRDANTKQIQDWYAGLVNQNKELRGEGDDFLSKILGSATDDTSKLMAGLSDDGAKSVLGRFGTVDSNYLRNVGVNEHDYMNNMSGHMAQAGVDAQLSQRRLDSQDIQSLRDKLAGLLTDQGQASAQARLDATAQNNQTLTNTEDRNYSRRADSVTTGNQNATARYNAQTGQDDRNWQRLLNSWDSQRTNAQDVYGADKDRYTANRANILDTFNAGTERGKTLFSERNAATNTALTKAITLGELAPTLAGMDLDNLTKMMGIAGASQKLANGGGTPWNPHDLGQVNGLGRDLDQQLTGLHPAAMGQVVMDYLQGRGIANDPVALRVARSRVNAHLHALKGAGGYGNTTFVVPNNGPVSVKVQPGMGKKK